MLVKNQHQEHKEQQSLRTLKLIRLIQARLGFPLLIISVYLKEQSIIPLLLVLSLVGITLTLNLVIRALSLKFTQETQKRLSITDKSLMMESCLILLFCMLLYL